MTMPSITLWTLDGPPDDISEEVAPPIPPKPLLMGDPKKMLTRFNGDYREEAEPDSDEDEFHDTDMTPHPGQWDWGVPPSNAYPKPTRMGTPPPSTTIAERILAGEHYTAAFSGTSQYARGGSSACGLASMNAIRLAFDFCSNESDGEALISALVSEQYVKDAMAIASSWPDAMHLEVEPILELPLFARSLRVIDVQYRESRFRTFSDALVALKSHDGPPGPRAVFLTRPPEMIAVMHIPLTFLTDDMLHPQTRSVYLIFDSHPRQDHPDGTAIQFFPSSPTDTVADYLSDLFQVDAALINDPSLEWHVQLLGQVSCHFLAPVEIQEVQTEYTLNMAFLALKQELAESKRKLEVESTENRRSRSRIFELQQEVAWLNNTQRKKQEELEQAKARLGEKARQHRAEKTDWGWDWNPNKKDSKGKGRENGTARTDSRSGGSGGPSSVYEWPKPQPSGSSRKATPSRSSTLPELNRNPGPSRSRHTDTTPEDAEMARSLQVTMAMQREFDEERTAILRDQSLAKTVERPKFDCGICMESFTDEAIALVDGCNHSSCRECMRSHVQSKIEERQYPIRCAFCVASTEEDSRANSGTGFISSNLVENIGVTPELFNVFTELQLAEHSIMIDCRSQSAFVDRKDYDLVEIIACPMPKCTYAWCKQCNQSVEGGARHSCDGSAELETLMNQRGWKHCPGCRTPIERSAGCNHMTCSTPGCNMHFCYICGAVVTRGGTRQEIQSAVSTHFRSCALFAVPREV